MDETTFEPQPDGTVKQTITRAAPMTDVLVTMLSPEDYADVLERRQTLADHAREVAVQAAAQVEAMPTLKAVQANAQRAEEARVADLQATLEAANVEAEAAAEAPTPEETPEETVDETTTDETPR